MKPRKLILIREDILAEAGKELERPLRRVAAIAVIANPYAGESVEDLSPLFEAGRALGEAMMPDLVAALKRPAIAYGKAAIVGTLGDVEHGAALLHPKLGVPIRAEIDGGKAIIPSTCKVAVPGATIDIPLGHKDNVWSFDHLDTMPVSVADAPRPGEILLAIALSEAGRPWPRVGKGRDAS